MMLPMLSGGCSWTLMTAPPDQVIVPSYPVQCTGSYVAPLLDSAGAALALVAARNVGIRTHDSKAAAQGRLAWAGIAGLSLPRRSPVS
jgi:hypothetical protein